MRPDARPTPRVSPAGASEREQADQPRHPDPEQQADGAEQQPLGDRKPDGPIGDRDGELGEERLQRGHG